MISDFIYSWLRNIIVLFMIIILVDLIMPKGNMKRYIDFFIGLILIYMVLSPFIRLTSFDIGLNESILKEFNIYENGGEDLVNNQAIKIEELYIKKLYSRIESLIEDDIEYEVDNIEIDIENGKSFGDIKRIDVMLLEKINKKTGSDQISIQKVKNIPLEQEKNLKNSGVGFKNIKTIIANDLQISEDVIYVYIGTREDLKWTRF